MAKISALPPLDEADGTETLPVVKAGRTVRMAVAALARAIVPFLVNYYRGDKGDPGGNVLSVGPFSGFSALNIPVGTDLVQTSGPTRGLLIADPTLTQAQADAHPLAIKKSANGRFFRRDPRDLWFEQFGARSVEDKSFDSSAAIVAAMAYGGFCGYLDGRRGGQFRGCPTLRFGPGRFYIGVGYITHRYAGTILGASQGHINAPATFLACEGSGFLAERAHTSDFFVITQPPYPFGSDGATIEGIAFQYVGPKAKRSGGRNGECGIINKGRMVVRRCQFFSFPSIGVFTYATAGAGNQAEGEASCGIVEECWFEGCWAGYHIEGADVNVIDVNNNTFDGCTFGINAANGFLSCKFTNNHFKNNGNLYHHNGVRYQCLPGRENAASTTAPGTNSAVWARVEDGGPFEYGADPFYSIVTWQSGMTIREAGTAILHTNRNMRSVFDCNYIEGSQAFPVIAWPAIVIGGQMITVPRESGGDAVFIRGELGSFSVEEMHVGRVNTPGVHAAGASATSDSYLAIDGNVTGPPLVLRARNKDYVVSIGQGDTTISMAFTGDQTTQTFGRNTPQKYAVSFPGGFAIGVRRWTTGLLPTSGYHSSGELIFDQDGGDRVGWKCTVSGTAGSTAVFKPFNTTVQ